jgi:hypothetical protein
VTAHQSGQVVIACGAPHSPGRAATPRLAVVDEDGYEREFCRSRTGARSGAEGHLADRWVAWFDGMTLTRGPTARPFSTGPSPTSRRCTACCARSSTSAFRSCPLSPPPASSCEADTITSRPADGPSNLPAPRSADKRKQCPPGPHGALHPCRCASRAHRSPSRQHCCRGSLIASRSPRTGRSTHLAAGTRVAIHDSSNTDNVTSATSGRRLSGPVSGYSSTGCPVPAPDLSPAGLGVELPPVSDAHKGHL